MRVDSVKRRRSKKSSKVADFATNLILAWCKICSQCTERAVWARSVLRTILDAWILPETADLKVRRLDKLRLNKKHPAQKIYSEMKSVKKGKLKCLKLKFQTSKN